RRDAKTMTNDAIPALTAVATGGPRGNASAATTMATTPAMATPNVSAVELRTAASGGAPAWAELAHPMKAAPTRRSGRCEKARTEAAATIAAASAVVDDKERCIVITICACGLPLLRRDYAPTRAVDGSAAPAIDGEGRTGIALRSG